MAEVPAATVVLGSRGLERDVVRHALRIAGLLTVDLVSLNEDGRAPIVAVLVDPSESDWADANKMHARIVVVQGGEVDPGSAVNTIVLGADAVVGSDLDVSELVDIIRTVASGHVHLSQEEADEVVDRLRKLPEDLSGQPSLTPRELDILTSIDRGDAVKQTARLLSISEKTVQNIQSRLFRKLSARNRAQAVAKAHELGLLVGTETSGAGTDR
jgi:DNA-binding NarL/FixJ family response regulator